MTDTELRDLIPQWRSEAKGKSHSSFWRWLKKRGISVGATRLRRIVAEYDEANSTLVPRRVREWEALGKDGQIVTLHHVTYDVAVDWRKAIDEAVKRKVRPLEPVAFEPAGPLLGVLSFPDLHLGQLSWRREVGANYDSRIAESLYRQAAAVLIDYMRRSGVGRVLYIVGNDLLHVDGASNATTNGTPQDVDSRWQYMFIRVRRLTEAVIRELATFAEVDVVIMPGNHDWHLAYALGHVIDATFTSFKNVSVDIEPRDYKYRVYDRVLFGIAHGDRLRDNDLPLLLAEEMPEAWAVARWKEWLLGHIHRKKVVRNVDVDQRMGVQLTYLPSLKALDKWHYKQGYRSRQAAEVRLYDTKAGVLHSYRPYYPEVYHGEEKV